MTLVWVGSVYTAAEHEGHSKQNSPDELSEVPCIQDVDMCILDLSMPRDFGVGGSNYTADHEGHSKQNSPDELSEVPCNQDVG